VVFLVISVWLYRVVPPKRRKSVSVAMMTAGGLMLASVLLRAWGVIEEDPVTDAVMIGFLIGGSTICMTGFTLYRHATQADH